MREERIKKETIKYLGKGKARIDIGLSKQRNRAWFGLVDTAGDVSGSVRRSWPGEPGRTSGDPGSGRRPWTWSGS